MRSRFGVTYSPWHRRVPCDSSKAGRGVVEGTTQLVNQDGDLVIDAAGVWLVATRP